MERACREIKETVDLYLEIYLDPERVIRRTRHIRGKAALDDAAVVASAATCRVRSRELIDLLVAQLGASRARAARIGLLMRIDRLEAGEACPATEMLGAHNDVISDEDLAPALSRRPGAKKTGTGETSKARFVVGLLKKKCGATVSESTIETDWKEARRMLKRERT